MRTGDLQDTGSTELYPGYAGSVYRWTVGAGICPFFPVAVEERPYDLLMQRG